VTHLLIPALIALLPAAFALWTGRRLLHLADDAAFAERLLAERTRSGVVSAVCVVLLLSMAWAQVVWAVPLLIGARMVVGYRIRKALYCETWSFACYLSFFGRLIVAAFGFWVALGMIPVVAMMAGSHDWMLAGVLAVTLGGWATAYSRVFSMLLRARPVGDPVILPRFAHLATQCGLRNVSLRQVDMRGGVFANAVALPSTTHPTVVVSSTLIERLDADETAGILAHELAHLEHYNARVLRRAARVTYALIGAAVSVAPLIRLVPQSHDIGLLLWPVILITTLVVRARHKQKHETASDLRAVALTGNPDALIRALTKLHAFARMPRRWDIEFERRATHPSLARRIQAIHAAAGTSPASIGEAAVFIGSDGKRSATFHHDRVEFNEGAGGGHAIGYGLLIMLRVDAKSSGAPRLVAVDSSNRRWDIVIDPRDVARAQAVLDIVDIRLGAVAAEPPPSLTIARALAVTAAMISAALGQFSVALVAWLGFARPASPLLAAAGAAAIGAAGLSWRDRFMWSTAIHPWMVLALLGCGLALIASRVLKEQEQTPQDAQRLIGALAAAALIAGGLVAASGLDALSLHQGARQWPSAGILTCSLAGALAFARSPRIRYAAVPVASVAMAVIFSGSAAFLDRFVADGFLARAEPLTVRTVTARPIAEFSVPFDVTEMRLSPMGRFVALASENDEERITIHAGPAGGPLTNFEADEAKFVSEGRLLLLERQRSATLLRLVDLERGGREAWSRRVPLWAVRLSFDGSSNTWHLLGWNDADDIVSVSGGTGGDHVREERWRAHGIEDVNALSVSNGAVLALETQYRSSRLFDGTFRRWAPLIEPAIRTESRFWTIGRQDQSMFAVSRLELSCQHTSADDAATICTAFDGMRTGFFEIDAATRRPRALASVNGRFYSRGDAGCGWLAGWWDHALLLVRASTREAISITDASGRRPMNLARSDNLLGAVFADGRDSLVRLYSID
jgi:Zn-dependent protease with chaperone function